MTTDIAALIGSRICHDLISPIGAIGNGVELLSMSGNSGSAELDLITQSVQNANARIRFFRIAYGAANPDQLIGRQEVLSVLAATALGGRLSYFWQITNDQSRGMVRSTFLLLQCMETAMPLGGDIQISTDGDTWVLTGTGPRIKIDQPMWGALLVPDDTLDIKAAHVQFALAPTVIADIDRRLAFTFDDTSLTLRF